MDVGEPAFSQRLTVPLDGHVISAAKCLARCELGMFVAYIALERGCLRLLPGKSAQRQ